MRFLVLRSEVFERHVRVLLRGGQTGMAQQFLDRPQVSPTFEEVSRKGMPECMRRQTPPGRKAKTCFFNQPLHITRVEAPPAQADKHGRVAISFRAREAEAIALSKIFRQSPSSIFAEMNDPLFSAFAEDSDQLLAEVDIFGIQAHQFANAQPARIEQF